MRLLLQLALILSCCFIGDMLHRVVGIPLPGNILSMLILLLLLCTKIVKIEQIEEMSNFFLKRLPFFFLPPAVGIISTYEMLKGNILILILLCVLVTVVTIAATGKATDLLLGILERRHGRE